MKYLASKSTSNKEFKLQIKNGSIIYFSISKLETVVSKKPCTIGVAVFDKNSQYLTPKNNWDISLNQSF